MIDIKQIINLVSANDFGQIFISDTDEQRTKESIKEINNSNKSSSNTYQHFMLHILTNFKGSSFVYDIRI